MTRALDGILQCDFTSPSKLTQVQWIQAALRLHPQVMFIEHPGNVDTIGDVIKAARCKCLVIISMGRRIDYLIDYLEWLGVSRCAASDSLVGALFQSLAPAVCPKCAIYYVPNPTELQELRIRCANPEQLSFAKAQGCWECNWTGQVEKVGLHEVATVTDELRMMFRQRKSDEMVRRHLLDCGMTAIYESAVQKLIHKKISSATAYLYSRSSYWGPQSWVDVDAESGLVCRTT